MTVAIAALSAPAEYTVCPQRWADDYSRDALIIGKWKDVGQFKGPITGSVKAGLPDRQSPWTQN